MDDIPHHFEYLAAEGPNLQSYYRRLSERSASCGRTAEALLSDHTLFTSVGGAGPRASRRLRSCTSMSLISKVAAFAAVKTIDPVSRPPTPGLASQPSPPTPRGVRGHLGQVPQSTDPAERPVYGRLETYRRIEPKGGNDEHQGRNTAGA